MKKIELLKKIDPSLKEKELTPKENLIIDKCLEIINLYSEQIEDIRTMWAQDK
jgi:hypothetical protein